MMSLDKPSRIRYFPNNKIMTQLAITTKLKVGTGTGKGNTKVKIAAHNKPTAAVLITVAKTFKTKNTSK